MYCHKCLSPERVSEVQFVLKVSSVMTGGGGQGGGALPAEFWQAAARKWLNKVLIKCVPTAGMYIMFLAQLFTAWLERFSVSDFQRTQLLFLVWLLRGFIHRDDEKGRRMWNMYLEREDSKVVGKGLTRTGFRMPLSSFARWLWTLVSDFRSVRRTAEELHDLHRLWLPLYCVRPILGPLHSHRTGQNTSLVWLSGSEHLVSSWVELISCCCFLTCSVSSQKNSGEVSLKDCLRLFTKEDVLDGEERPVRSLEQRAASLFLSVETWILQLLCLSVFVSHRHATDAKPGGNAPKDSAFRSSRRSLCFVSLFCRNALRWWRSSC